MRSMQDSQEERLGLGAQAMGEAMARRDHFGLRQGRGKAFGGTLWDKQAIRAKAVARWARSAGARDISTETALALDAGDDSVA